MIMSTKTTALSTFQYNPKQNGWGSSLLGIDFEGKISW